jgi:predicted polyphosphate/ATP-dependent NAD kinase
MPYRVNAMGRSAGVKKLGLIVNPIAGLGGRVGLKGSDGAEIQQRARTLGAIPQASHRAVQALERLWPLRGEVELIAYAGEMGEEAARLAAWPATVVGTIEPGATTAVDTQRAVRELCRLEVDLLLFAGGDGTARDVCQVAGCEPLVLGIPAGVKIHSAVYATSAVHAGDLALLVLRGQVVGVREAEVMDVNEDALRQGVISTRLYGYLRVPEHRRLVQGRKAPSPLSDAAAAEAIAASVVERMEPGVLYILGPGTTLRSVAARLGLPKTLAGVDVVLDGRRLAADANEARLLELVRAQPARILVTPIGGQGHLLGRGNQQLSPAVLRAVGREGLIVVSTPAKVHSLQNRPFLLDTGDPALDRQWAGHVRAITGYHEEIIYRVSY